MSRRILIFAVISFVSCSGFNSRLNRSDRVIAVDGAGAFVEPFLVNLTSGALTSQGQVTTTIVPTRVAASRASSIFLISNTTEIQCYRYVPRLGTGPTKTSTTSITGTLSRMDIAIDDLTVVYSKVGSGSLFWRTLDGSCNLGSEQSVSLPGATGEMDFRFSDSGDVVFSVEPNGSFVWKILRNTSTGALSTVTSAAIATCGTTPVIMGISPDGTYGFFCSNSGNDFSAIKLSSMTISSVTPGSSVELIVPTTSSRGVILSIGITHWGFTLSSSGTPSVSASVDFSLPDIRYGAITNPERTLIYSGGPVSTSLWIHRVSSTEPFVSSVISSVLGFDPVSFAYLPGYSR